MHVGHYISGAAHLSFLLWLVLGDVFTSKPDEISITTISIISTQQFEKEFVTDTIPQVSDEIEGLNQIESDQTTSNPTVSEIDKQVPANSPKVPDIPKLHQDNIELPKQIQSVIPDLSNEPDQPGLNQDDPSPAPLPETTETQSPVIADRVASVPVIPQNEDPFNNDAIDSLIQVPADQENSDFKIEEQNQSTRGATTEIITEPKKKPSGAPKKSLRPKGRPQILTENETKDTPSEDLVDAVSSALSNIENEPENSESLNTISNTSLNSAATIESIGNALLKQIEPCWNVDVGNQNAYVKVTVAFSLDKNGKIERNEIKLVSSEGGEGSAARSAFTNAKKTIFKCQKKWDGFNLQDFDYEQWQQIVLTFNPDQMRNR
ncbi:hypothetical protein OA846_03185 [Paracoccaceae bacterium]|nr:hypothetical protein [Paracoccaceae bacterium]